MTALFHPARQAGMATLTVVLTLVLVLTGLAFSLGQTSLTEQRMATNQRYHGEALAAAEAGLAFGQDVLLRETPRWLRLRPDLELATPVASPPRLRASNGERFALNLVLRRDPRHPAFVTLEAEAQANRIQARARLALRLFSVLSEPGEKAPPLLLDGCPGRGPLALLPAPDPIAPSAALSGDGHCVRPGTLLLNGGRLQPRAFPRKRLWEHLFGVDRQEFRALAAREAAQGKAWRDRRHWWASPGDLRGGQWSLSLGTPERPVVIVFPASLGCPPLADGTRIHGILFVDADCGAAPAWGSVQIYGVLAVAGDAPSVGPWTRIAHISRAMGQPPRLKLPVIAAAPVPGTWSDL